MQILLDYNALEHRKSCILSSVAKIVGDMPEPDVYAIKVLLQQYDEIKKLQELALQYCKVQ